MLDMRTKSFRFGPPKCQSWPVDASATALLVCPAESPAVPTAWTPSLPAAIWTKAALPVTFTPALPLPRALGEDALAELTVAARTWSEVGCTSYRAALAAPAALVPGDDGINGIFFHEDAWPAELMPGVLGQTVLTTDAAGNLHDADVHLNGVDFTWSLATNPADGKIDLRGVVLHEMGHALGLGHSQDPRASMNASHPPGIAWRSLEQDDRDGVCALYPGTGAAACDAGGAPCPAPLVCVAGRCERKGQRGTTCAPCARVPDACDGAGDDARCNDLPSGAGRVCGRACAADADCGARFHCAAQTAAGNRQCVPTDGCASGPNPCAADAECAPDGVCRGGACVGPIAPDGTPDAGAAPDAASAPAPTAAGGCQAGRASRGARAPGGVAIFAAALFFVAVRRRRA